MSIISKETWDNLIPEEEKEKIKQDYQKMLDGKTELTEEEKEALRPQPLTYRDIERELFKDKKSWYINEHSSIQDTLHLGDSYRYKTNLMTSRRQAEKLLAVNRLLNVAKFLNKDWKPDWKNEDEWKYTFWLRTDLEGNVEIKIDRSPHVCQNFVYFRTEELAKQAIQILGEKTVRLALTTEY